MRCRRTLLLASVVVTLAGCAGSGPVTAPPAPERPALPAAWQAPIAHGGSVTELSAWWALVGDDTLPEFVALAQAASPSLSAARARLERARTELTIGQAALGPTLEASANATRGNAQYPLPLSRTAGASLAASWEADLFGRNRFAAQAAQARAEAAQSLWHDARVVIAAETAVQYLSLRYCEAVLEQLAADLRALDALTRLARLNAEAGLQASAAAEGAAARQAGASSRLLAQQAACDLDVKALVALTALAEPDLRQRLARHAARELEVPPALVVRSLPAQVVAQRPDVLAAEREVLAAASLVGEARTLRLPRLSLGGSIGAFSVQGGPLAADLSTWSIGPIRLQVPVFDGGVAQARVQAAQAEFDHAVRQFDAKARQAIREVEEALVQAHFTSMRLTQVRGARLALERSLRATEQRVAAGLDSRQSLEEARRAVIDIRINELAAVREGLIAGVSLYRTAGGGWNTP
jgi:NodT family efflux transporter outer membrane factor (OMF) lipoprotein